MTGQIRRPTYEWNNLGRQRHITNAQLGQGLPDRVLVSTWPLGAMTPSAI